LPKPKKEKKRSTFWNRSGRRDSTPVESQRGSVTPPISVKHEPVAGGRERSVSNVDLTQTTST